MKGFLMAVFSVVPVVLYSTPAAAAVYKCTAHGEIVYAAHPCGKHAVKLQLKDHGYSIPLSTKPKAVKSSRPARVREPRSRACPIDVMNSIELRNMRVSHVIMVCESAADVRATWGRPDVVTRTVSKGHVRERWVYDGPRGKPARSVNLEDGKVTSFKN
ncbi:MAG TPA: hypothetical protein VF117_07420 [Gammaproteobacteria bacterium]